MQPIIYKADNVGEYYFDEGCYILEVARSPLSPGLSIARARVTPGVSTRWHRLKGITERYAICQGAGTVEVGDLEPQRVEPNDVVQIPPMCPQRITNTGDTDLVFLAICTPGFVADAYEDIDSRD